MDGFKLTEGEFIFILDADLSHHPKYMPAFVEKQREENYDVVTGTRYAHGGSVYGWNLMRVLTSRVANYVADTLLQPKVSDLTGSFRLYKKDVFENILKNVVAKGYTFQMEIMYRARINGCSIAEVPISFVDRIFGSSKMGSNEIVGYLKGVFFLFNKV
eukprot:TRINITY_DN2933_c4_g3_i3.p1 TRINITY_DN2933_c4_g3~~TRINITY_DN2933_c4_g3_i3.p1  ORF type:complete len:159 (+),score=52.94 TRINITY_DN2933_c4_g3_i3:325-801(+)